MTIRQGSTLRLVHTGMLDDGTVIDKSTPEEPLELRIGMDLAIDGFEREVGEMAEGEKKTFVVKDYDAFGEYLEHLQERVPIETVPRAERLSVGDTVWMMDEEGTKFPVTVLAIEAENILFDFNHPLAGKDLTYEVELLSIDESTALSEEDIEREKAKERHMAEGGMMGDMGMTDGTVAL